MPSDYVSKTFEKYEVTAYTAGYESTGKRPGDKYYGITASGAKVIEGQSLACPPEIPFGTRIWISTVGERVCDDRGGAIKGKRLDVYIPELSKALRFGRQMLSIEIIEEAE